MPSCVFAVDFSHEEMTAGFVTPDGEEVGTAVFDLKDFMAGESSPLDKLLSLLAAKARTAPAEPQAVAVSVAGEIDRSRRTIVSFPQAAWLNSRPLPEVLSGVLGIPVMMERRAVAALAYDRIILGLPEDCVVLGCYVDTHYETAIWHNGSFLTGKNGGAGNIAHIPIQDREDNCFCGRTGCVDLYGAGVRLNQLHSMIFPDIPLAELFVRHGEHPIVADYLSMMAYPIAIEADILDPDFIVLGGRIPAMKGFPSSVLRDAVTARRTAASHGEGVVYAESPASAGSAVMCAAQYAFTNRDQLGS